MAEAHAALVDGGAQNNVALEETPCAYMCGVAPVAEIDGEWRGRLGAGKLSAIIGEVSS